MKDFTSKQVFILVAVIIIGIAFMETSSALWTLDFWREFLLKVIIYGAISEFLAILISSTKYFNR